MSINNFFDFAVKALPEFCDYIVPYAKKCGISPVSAFAMIVLKEHCDLFDFYFEGKGDVINELLDKLCIKVENEKPILTTKGEIVAKSLIMAKQGFICK